MTEGDVHLFMQAVNSFYGMRYGAEKNDKEDCYMLLLLRRRVAPRVSDDARTPNVSSREWPNRKRQLSQFIIIASVMLKHLQAELPRVAGLLCHGFSN